MRTSSTFNDIATADLEPEEIERPGFTIRSEENLEIASRLLKELRLRYLVDEKGIAMHFTFFHEIDRNIAYRNIKKQIDRSQEGSEWK